MAHIETWWRCCCCQASYGTQKEAIHCAASHVCREQWAVGRYKKVRIYDNYAPDSAHGIDGALKEADLSDNIEERRRQLAEMEKTNKGKGETHTTPVPKVMRLWSTGRIL